MSHAVLSPSASHRWLVCTPSARAESGVHDEDSEFAVEGTYAHVCAALALDGGTPNYLDDEMREAVESYEAIVRGKYESAKEQGGATMLIEQELDLSAYVPGSFGTADAVVLSDDLIEVIDFKYGKGVKVDAKENTQMMMYAVGALEAYRLVYAGSRVKMTIVQPRIGNVSSWELSVADLMQWAENVLKPKALIAYEGKGEEVPGAHCQFCKVRGRCAALAKAATTAPESKGVDLMSDEEVAEAYGKLDMVKIWCKAVEDEAMKVLTAGRALPGYKLVEGMSRRKYADEAALMLRLMEMGYSSTEICKPNQLLGLTDMKKALGTAKFREIVEPACVRASGAPVIAPMSDKRESIDYKNDFTDL